MSATIHHGDCLDVLRARTEWAIEQTDTRQDPPTVTVVPCGSEHGARAAASLAITGVVMRVVCREVTEWEAK